MGENTKNKILSQDLVRRLLILSEKPGAGAKNETIDQYEQKLVSSVYSRKQVRRITLK